MSNFDGYIYPLSVADEIGMDAEFLAQRGLEIDLASRNFMKWNLGDDIDHARRVESDAKRWLVQSDVKHVVPEYQFDPQVTEFCTSEDRTINGLKYSAWYGIIQDPKFHRYVLGFSYIFVGQNLYLSTFTPLYVSFPHNSAEYKRQCLDSLREMLRLSKEEGSRLVK